LNNLFKAFTPKTKADWLAKVEKDLKGKPMEGLNWQPVEGLTLSPFAHADDVKESLAPLTNDRTQNHWEIGVIFSTEDMKTANKAALEALQRGANAIAFRIDRSLELSEIGDLLKDIQLEWMSTHFIFSGSSFKQFAKNFLAFVAQSTFDSEKINCSFSIKGNTTDTEGERKQLCSLNTAFPKAKLFTIDGQRFYKGSEKTNEELAKILKAGNEILNQLNQGDLGVEKFYESIQFSITLGDSYFINIAKIRALKLLWAQVLEAWDSKLSSSPIIEVHLAEQSQTTEENYNKIKVPAQAMSAAIGGAQRLYIYPSDATEEKEGSEFAKRIAWNVQHLMQLESYMDRVIDPAAGSYYIESLTNHLAKAAWEKFQEIS